MNIGIVRYIMGWLLLVVAGFMILPAAVSLYFGEKCIWAFVYVILGAGALGGLLICKKPKNHIFYTAEGYVSVALSWIVMSLVGAVPFVISGAIPSYIDALFETVSGFTTTGASILPEIESLPKGILFWRSLTHWLGGMGVLVFLLCLIPLTGGSRMNLMKAESPGPQVGRLVPKVQSTAKILYGIYISLTMAEILILIISGMRMFDAVTISFGTAGTGGFGVMNDSCGSYTNIQQSIIIVFMILFGVNFNVYFLILLKNIKGVLKSEEVWAYFAVIVISVTIITVNTIHMYEKAYDAFHHAAFAVGSIITTTGFATVDFNTWPALSKTVLCILMFIGACAGSTGGGIKVSRFLLLIKTIKKQITTSLHPNAVCTVKMDGKPVEEDVLRNVHIYLITYVLIFALSLLFISADNHDLTTNFTAVSATFNNIGPGLSLVGPTSNFTCFSDLSKMILSLDMLFGRLEIFPLLMLLNRRTWKRM
ncbi:MAG: TrkH family potassium uptake protein [Lachnospiraceae bacterium]|jgi:trk system potassium uptake protein TrkH|nr:TrkH family potassium uptake protein [Lachnospiraceae bacterium]MBQ3967570.1 TrkH family potassium uptake protein [Lachnospiraceae bacterium]